MNGSIDFSNFEAVIFDMDGVLIDSEPLWKIVMEKVFAEVGCDLKRKDFEKTVGLRIDEVVHYWFQHRPWKTYSVDQVVEKIMIRMVEIIKTNGKPMVGVLEAIQFFKCKNLKIAVATSSYTSLLNQTLQTLGLDKTFETVCSAENEEYGKPHPAVFLKAAHNLGVSPRKCLVIEDSLNGIIAAKSACMTVVCIPEITHIHNPKLSLADYEFENLIEMIKEF
jgi:mannitol-1-/sugar-/sorbitol-6-/2-deoxyglucose-6-phosphatase